MAEDPNKPADPTPPADPPKDPPADPPKDPPADPPKDPPKDDWRSELPEDFRNNEALSVFNSPADLAKAFLERQQQDPAPKAEDYELPENFPLQGFREVASKAGLSKDQVKELSAYYTEQTAAEIQEANKQNDAKLKELFTEWGDKKDAFLSGAGQVVKHFDTEEGEMKEFLKQSGAHRHPVVLKFLARIGNVLREDDYLKSEVDQPPKKKDAAKTLYPNLN